MMSSTLLYAEETVPIEKIKEDEEFKSLIPQNNSREDLENSLKEKSQIFPLIVDKNYVLIDGYTRLDIMRKLQFKEVRVLKYEFDAQQERDKAYELIWMFNGVRRQLDKNEKLALFQKIADKIAKIKSSKNITEQSKIDSPVSQFLATESKQIQSEETVTLEDGTVISARQYELILKELDKENKALTTSDKKKFAILRINAPWLAKYVTDPKYKVPLDQVFRIYTKSKELGILDKLKDLPQALRDPLITTREGRKIILNDEYKDLLEKVLSKQYTAERAINEVKQRESAKRGRKSKKKSSEIEEEEEEDEEEEIEEEETEVGENDEYPFVEEWQKVNEEEQKEQQPSTREQQPKTIEGQPNTIEVQKQQPPQLSEKQEGGKSDLITELKTKGFAELPFEIALVKVNGKCYALNVEALIDIQAGEGEQWNELIQFLSKNNLVIPGEAEGIYDIIWRKLGRCVEWK